LRLKSKPVYRLRARCDRSKMADGVSRKVDTDHRLCEGVD